ncbi:MAG: U32 family peptidase [Bacteroidota bacterium]|nr:U32 family peptidase [Bacteroidota bacterium]
MSFPKVELMAPAGNFDSLAAAIQAGADSIYFGVEQLNMRSRSSVNFTVHDLKEIATRCKAHHVKTYLTLNTIVYDHDLALMKLIINSAKQVGIDAVIAADQAVIAYANKQKMEVHISTQLNITNVDTVEFYARFADVMVLSRELSIRQIKGISDAIKKQQIKGPSGKLVQIEVFAHGSLCMAVSGKCYLSLHTHNASANRGACVQNCRRKYKVIDIEDGHELELDNEYIMSPKDLCTIDFLNELIAAGVNVLKIEGRGKSADYVKTVTQCYREAIDLYYEGMFTQNKVKEWKEQLQQVYNRDFWGGYYLGKELGEWTDTAGSKALTRKIYLGKGSRYFSKSKIAEFEIESYSLEVGDKIAIIGPTTGVIEHVVASLHVNEEGAKTTAAKGDLCAFPLDVPIRKSDKLYKIVAAEEVVA